MRWLAVIILFLAGFFCLAQSNAQVPTTGAGKTVPGGGGGSYTGPGDIATFVGWWGLRAYSAATAGNKAISLYKSSDGYTTPHDISTVVGTGALNIGDAFFDGSTYKVNILYDQVGSHDIPTGSSTAGNFTLTGGPGAAAKAVTMLGNGADYFGPISFTSLPEPFTIFSVAQRTGAFTSLGPIFGDGVLLFSFDSTAAQFSIGDGSAFLVAAETDSAFHTATAQYVSGTNNSLVNIDGGSDSVGTLSTDLSGISFYTFATSGGARFTGKFQEVGIIASAPNSTVRSQLITNAKTTYWGF